MALPRWVAVPAKVDFDDSLFEAWSARGRRGRHSGAHLEHRHAAVPFRILGCVTLEGCGGATVGAQRVSGAFGRQGGELSGGIQVKTLSAWRSSKSRPIGMEKGIVHEHEHHAGEETAEDDTECWNGEGVSGVRKPVEIPQRTESSVLHQDHQVIDEKPTPAGTSDMML